MHQTHGDHYDAPQKHNGGQENGRPELFQQDLGQRLKERIGDEEDGQGVIVLIARHVEIFLKAIEFCVTDIRAIQEADQVQQGKPGN